MQRKIMMADIGLAIEEVTGFGRLAIRSLSRSRKHVVARHAFCRLARRLTHQSFAGIGQFINRDHSTVVHAVSMRGDLALELEIQIIELKAMAALRDTIKLRRATEAVSLNGDVATAMGI